MSSEKLSEKIERLTGELQAAMDQGQHKEAKRIRQKLMDLLDDGKENDSIKLDYDDEFVRRWYNDGW